MTKILMITLFSSVLKRHPSWGRYVTTVIVLRINRSLKKKNLRKYLHPLTPGAHMGVYNPYRIEFPFQTRHTFNVQS